MNDQRLLVVDDDDAIRTLLKTVLRRRGFAVDVAHNGSEAAARIADFPYAVVILDLMMPVMNGYDFIAWAKTLAPERRPVVLVLTAAGSPPRQLDCSIVAGTLRKPFDLALLIDVVGACLAGRTAEEGRTTAAVDEGRPRRSDPPPTAN